MSIITKKFLVVAMARTGSNALISALRQHPHCYTDFELFHGKHIPGPLAEKFSLSERDADPYAFLGEAVAEAIRRKPETQSYGFKIFFTHNDELLAKLIVDPAWPVVLMRRENTLDQFLSLRIAVDTNVWNSNDGTAKAKIEFKEKEFLFFKNRVDGFYENCEQQLKAAGQPFHRVSYADITAGNYGPLCDFLGLAEPHDLVPKLYKQNPTGTADKVENPDEARAVLERLGMAHFWVD